MTNENSTVWNDIKQAFHFAKKRIISKHSKNDLKEAEEALVYCAENGDVIAQYQLYALQYQKVTEGNGYKTPIYWCQKAAEQGYAPAQYDLAIHYLYGEEIQQDYYEAIKWLEQSAYRGYQLAAQKLVTLYTAGTKIRTNPSRAEYWRTVICDNGITEEIGQLLPVTKEMLQFEDGLGSKREEVIVEETLAYNTLFRETVQDEVISAENDKSFIINAGPGTGKTYVLINRINYLVNHQVDPQEIVVVTFTNSVVAEVKCRLRQFVETGVGERSLRNVSVKTFHSFAYELLKIANEELEEYEWSRVELSFNQLTYEDCLIKAAELIETVPDIVSGWQYFIVDEIQDINNAKAKFILAVLKACIQYNCPFMLLGDSCQAIYDYLDNVDNSAGFFMTSEQFYQSIIELAKGKAHFCSFSVNHRQIEPLQKMVQPLREAILEVNAYQFKNEVEKLQYELKTKKIDDLHDYIRQHDDFSICIMERNNFNTKLLSAKFIQMGIEHMCVLNGSKSAYPRWMGEIFSGVIDDYLSKTRLMELVEERKYDNGLIDIIWTEIQKQVNGSLEIIETEKILQCLKSHELDKIIDIPASKNKIWVSNIHRSKGLEYDAVWINENYVGRESASDLGEMKTLYVAVTRPKKELVMFDAGRSRVRIRSYKDYRGKRYVSYEKPKKSGQYRFRYIEIKGGEEDPDVGPGEYTYGNMERSQQIIRTLQHNDPIVLQYDKENEKYAIIAKEEVIGYMSYNFTKAIMRMTKGQSMPVGFNEIYVDEIYTYIGSHDGNLTVFEQKLSKTGSIYAKYRVWNYVAFSGPAHPIYEE